MRVIKDCPFEFSYLVWQVKPPQNELVVIIKATFDLVHEGVATPSKKQAPCGGEQYWDDDVALSLMADTDHAIFKPRGECFASGTAHAPGGNPAPMVGVGFRVGAVSRRAAVFGDRHWGGIFRGGATEPQPFASMPLRYEIAFGGPQHAANPVGRGLSPQDTPAGPRVLLPNLEDAQRPVTSSNDRPPTAGFFPIPRMWRARVSKAGSYDQKWVDTRWPWLPLDFDWSYFNAAPPEQQIQGYWKGDEAVELVGFHPTKSPVRSELPNVRARAFVELRRGESLEFVEVPLRFDTITLHGDSLTAQCVWRGRVDIAHDKAEDVETLFYFDEPADAPLSQAECYARWEARRDEEAKEAQSFEIEPPSLHEDDEEDPPTEMAALPEPGPGVPMAPFIKLMAGMTASIAAVQKSLPKGASLTRLIDAQPPAPPMKLPSEIKAEMKAEGKEVPAEIEALEDPKIDTSAEVANEDGQTPPPDAPPALTREDVEARAKPGASFKDMDLSGLDLSHLDLSEVDFTGAILAEAKLTMCRMFKTVFDGANLRRADLSESYLKEASFRESELADAVLDRCNAKGAVFDHASGDESSWRGTRLVGASFKKAWMEHAALNGADLTDAVLDESDFTASDFGSCVFNGASLVDASFEKVKAEGASMEGCKLASFRASEGAVFRGVSFAKSDAPGSQWSGSILDQADLGGVVLDKADFTGARLVQANLTAASAKQTCFQDAVMVGARLIKSNAFEASFEGADLTHADLRGANLFGAQFWRARVDHAQIDLANVKRTHLEKLQKK